MNIEQLKKRSKELKKNIYLLYLIFKHPKTPWYAKLITMVTVIYAVSPIDLIPDFVPVLGYLDDLIIVPAGILLSLKLTPKEIIDECKQKEDNFKKIKNYGKYAAAVIILFWLWIIYIVLRNFVPYLGKFIFR